MASHTKWMDGDEDPRPDHEQRLARARLALEGLSVGDAFGQQYLGTSKHSHYVRHRLLFKGPWPYTDDTTMAVSVVECLARHGRIDQDDLARAFARRYAADPDRGYGLATGDLLEAVAAGGNWRVLSAGLFDGHGSMGNGSAMRVGPVGAYFANDLDAVVEQARASAQVTHAHPEGQAGAVATAVAAAYACRSRGSDPARRRQELIPFVIERIPAGPVRKGLERAAKLPLDAPIEHAAASLGNGELVTCPNTVPLCLWCAAMHLNSYAEALWNTVAAFGDMDTNCAIVGSIVVLATGCEAIPNDWLVARETLPPD
jgi:ADP-ribosylglycohydrolase